MKRRLLILIIIGSLFAPFASQTTSAGIPTPQTRRPAPQKAAATATAPARLPEAKYVNKVLANGLEVIVLEDHSVPIVTIALAVKNGSYTEPPELNGLSHLY